MSDFSALRQQLMLNGFCQKMFRDFSEDTRREVIAALVELGVGDYTSVNVQPALGAWPEKRCPRCGQQFDDRPGLPVMNDVFGSSWVHQTCVII